LRGTHGVLTAELAMPRQHVKPGEARWVLTSTCSAAQRCTVRIDSFRFIDPIRSAAAAAAPARILLGVPVSTWEYPLVLRSLQPRPCLRPTRKTLHTVARVLGVLRGSTRGSVSTRSTPAAEDALRPSAAERLRA
jgi:hypothetical protein